jgi:hypothetical protein
MHAVSVDENEGPAGQTCMHARTPPVCLLDRHLGIWLLVVLLSLLILKGGRRASTTSPCPRPRCTPRARRPPAAGTPPPPARRDSRRRVSRPPARPRPKISPRQQWKLCASGTGNLASATSAPSSSPQHCGQSIDVSCPVPSAGTAPPLHATARPSHRLRRHLLLSRRQWKERTSSPHGRYAPLRPQIARRHRRSARPQPLCHLLGRADGRSAALRP